jgi:hypothetical protein
LLCVRLYSSLLPWVKLLPDQKVLEVLVRVDLFQAKEVLASLLSTGEKAKPEAKKPGCQIQEGKVQQAA